MTTTSEQQAVSVAQEDEARATLAAEMVDNHAASSFLAGKDRLISTRAALRAMHRFARLTPIEGVAASEKRQCSVCAAIVASYKGGMCCHCHELPWAVIEPTPSPAIPEGTSGEGVDYGEGIGSVHITPEIHAALHRALLASSTPVSDATQTREAEMAAALKPFAEAAGDCDYHDGTPAMREYPDDSSLPELNDLTIGDLRRARAALSAGAAKGEAR